jgi:hypothetical protein
MSLPSDYYSSGGISAPASTVLAVTPSDTVSFENVAVTLYITGGGALHFITLSGSEATVTVPDNCFWPVRVSQVLATGTTATGIFALV